MFVDRIWKARAPLKPDNIIIMRLEVNIYIKYRRIVLYQNEECYTNILSLQCIYIWYVVYWNINYYHLA